MKQSKGPDTCDRCDMPPFTRVQSGAGKVELCVTDTLVWFPGKDMEWLESVHSSFSNHLDDMIQAAREREEEANERARLAAIKGRGQS